MKSAIFIPKKIKIGFNLRNDTYTGKLGYVIYHDGKKWRKEDSWEGWRVKYMDAVEYESKKKQRYDAAIHNAKQSHASYIEYAKKDSHGWYKKYAEMTEDEFVNQQVAKYEEYYPNIGNVSDDEGVKPVEYTNEPLEGFVLNKKVGGYKSDWNFRQAYTRVYDPRGFEFEITIPNLLYILENANSIKGKGLEGKFIYGWDGKDLVLIPEEAPEYKEMVTFTETLALSVKAKDLKIGGIYTTSSGSKVTYLAHAKNYGYDGATTGEKVHWFYDNSHWTKFKPMSLSSIKKYEGDNSDIANLLDQLEKSEHYKPKVANVYKYELHTNKSVTFSNYSSHSDTYVYLPAKSKGKYTKAYVQRNYNGGDYYLTKGYRGNPITEKFRTLELLIEKHPIYKQLKIKENESEGK